MRHLFLSIVISIYFITLGVTTAYAAGVPIENDGLKKNTEIYSIYVSDEDYDWMVSNAYWPKYYAANDYKLSAPDWGCISRIKVNFGIINRPSSRIYNGLVIQVSSDGVNRNNNNNYVSLGAAVVILI